MNLQVKTILHPTDFSDAAQPAFKLACSLARDHGARVIALHVGAPPLMVTDGVMTAPPPFGDEYDRARLEVELRQAIAGVPDVPLETVVVFGTPAERIVDMAKTIRADLIIMGTHGRSGLGRLLMGSVAEKVLRQAPCPVLLVKPPPAVLPANQRASAQPVLARP